jgi:hypothetical protein
MSRPLIDTPVKVREDGVALTWQGLFLVVGVAITAVSMWLSVKSDIADHSKQLIELNKAQKTERHLLNSIAFKLNVPTEPDKEDDK